MFKTESDLHFFNAFIVWVSQYFFEENSTGRAIGTFWSIPIYNIMNFWRNSNVRCILEFTSNNMRTKCMSNDDGVGMFISFIYVMCILFSACVPRFASLLFSPFVLVHFFPVTAFNIKKQNVWALLLLFVLKLPKKVGVFHIDIPLDSIVSPSENELVMWFILRTHFAHCSMRYCFERQCLNFLLCALNFNGWWRVLVNHENNFTFDHLQL